MVLLCANSMSSQTVSTLPVYENFSYTVGSTIFPSATAAANTNGQGPWSTPLVLTKDGTLIVASPSWDNPGLSTSIGGAALQIQASGADPEIRYTPSVAGFGAIYSSFAMSVTSQASATVQLTGAGGYFYAMSSPTTKRAAVYLRFTEANKYQIGISTSSSSTNGITAWCPTILSVGDKIFVVVKYTESGEAILFVNPTISSNQPVSGFQKSTETASAVLPDRILINANSTANTPQIVIDEIRIATNWSQAIGGLAIIPTTPPTAEKRQAFDSFSNPTVNNLVSIGTAGATLKWYSVLGGTALESNTPLTSGTYYVTQTIGSNESDVVATQVFVGDTSLKTLPLYESFIDYTVGDKLILMKNGASTAVSTNQGIGLGSWSMTNSSNITDDVTIVTSPTWATTVIPARSPADKAITFVGSGIDPELKFTNTTSGSLFSSFLFTAADVTTIVNAQAAADADAGSAVTLPSGIDPAKSTPTGFYGFANESTDPSTSVVSTGYASDVMFRKVFANGTTILTNKFNIGLSKSNNGADCVWSPVDYDFGTQHLIVISYENIGDATATNQVAKLWIDPASSTQPAVTLFQSAPSTSRSNIDRIKILQGASAMTPTLVIDEIRVANNWGQALGGPSTLGVAKMDLTSLKVYPNPVTNGKLFISSANAVEKQVAIYSILGQKVLETKTTNNAEINVSKLAKGAYILKISEEGVSNTKKLIIQ